MHMYAYEYEYEDVLGRVHSGLEQSSGWRSREACREPDWDWIRRAGRRGGGDGEMRRCAPHQARATGSVRGGARSRGGRRVVGGL